MTMHSKRLLVGKINGLFGVQGWVKLFSHTHPRKNILTYQPWHVQIEGVWSTLEIVQGRVQGKTLVAQLQGVNNREDSQKYIGTEIYIEKSQLPKLSKGEHYWEDLIGLEVINQQGVVLGRVSNLVDTGANHVLVINGEMSPLSKACDPVPTSKADGKKFPSRGDKKEPFSREDKKESPSRGDKKEHWVPYIAPFLCEVSIEKKQILVDWDADF